MDYQLIIPFVEGLLFPSRQFDIICWYLLSIILPADKHSQANASKHSEKESSLFSKMLANSLDVSKNSLDRSSRRRLGRLMKKRRALVPGVPWTIAIIIDATLHERSSRHVENSKKFNHGKGWVTGHQWTNIVISINGQVVPLPPIPFYTKKESQKRKIQYKSEPKKVVEFLRQLDLTDLLGTHNNSEVVVLMDSGYDTKKLQSTIIEMNWDFICSLTSSRTASKIEGKSKKWINIQKYISRGHKPEITIRIASYRGIKKRLRQHAVKQREGYLKGVRHKVQLVCSKRSKESKLKYMACSNLNVSIKSILMAYRERWLIELFHRDLKSYLGLEDAGVRKFDSLHAHVLWVYTTFNIIKAMSPEGVGIKQGQIILEQKMKKRETNKVLKLLSRINGNEHVKAHCQSVIGRIDAMLAA